MRYFVAVDDFLIPDEENSYPFYNLSPLAGLQ